jgi:hypothetical protein
VQAALDAVPELQAVLPPTAIGKDFPYDGRWIGLTTSGTEPPHILELARLREFL